MEFLKNVSEFESSLQRSRGVFWITVVSVVLLALYVLSTQILHASRYLAADSFTYFAMARVFHDTGLLFSYSGLDHTTGVHPLYYLLVTALFPFFGMLIPEWSFVLNGLFLIVGLLLCYRALGFIPAVVMALLVFVQQAASATNNGMESALVFLGLSAILFFLTHTKEANFSRTEALLLGFLLGLLVAARLDSIFFVGVYLAFYGIQRLTTVRSARDLWSLVGTCAYIGTPFVIILSGIFLLNTHYDGTLLPLSGQLKSAFPHFSFSLETLRLLKTSLVAVVALGVYVVSMYIRGKKVGIFIPALFISTTLLFLYNFFFVYGIGGWYGALPFFGLAIALGLLVRELFNVLPSLFVRMRTSLFISFIILAAVLAAGSHTARTAPDWALPHERAIKHLAEVALPGESAGEFKDGVGAFYSTKVPVFNLTGLGNNREYAEALQMGGLSEYLKNKNIQYIVGGNGSGIQVPGAREYLLCSSPFYEELGVKLYRINTCKVVEVEGEVDAQYRADFPWDAQ